LELICEPKRQGKKLGVVTPCIGGGEATAVMVETVKWL